MAKPLVENSLNQSTCSCAIARRIATSSTRSSKPATSHRLVDSDTRRTGRPPIGVDLGAHRPFRRVFFSYYPDGERCIRSPTRRTARCSSGLSARTAKPLAGDPRVRSNCRLVLRCCLRAGSPSPGPTRDAPGATKLPRAMPYLAEADLVKIDIEGSGVILEDARFMESRCPRRGARVPPAGMPRDGSAVGRPPSAHSPRMLRRRHRCPTRATRRGDAVGVAFSPLGLVRIICLVTGHVRTKAG